MRGRRFPPPNREKKTHRIQRDNSLPLIALKTIACIIFIQLSIWGYFSIKGVSYVAGIKGWQNSFRELMGLEKEIETPKPIIASFKEKPVTNTVSSPRQYKPKRQIVQSKPKVAKQKSKNNLYKWVDKDGKVHFSNTTYPTNNPNLEIIPEKNNYNPETKFTYKNGTIIVPVTVRNNGRRRTIRLMLDTGCSITQLHPDIIRSLNPKKIRNGRATIANGKKIKTTIYEVDFFQIGPHKESNFTVSTNTIKSKNGIDGLLGMNFLNNHPFSIDKNKNVIRWE